MYFSWTLKALNFDFQIQGLSRTFKVRANPELKGKLLLESNKLNIVSGWLLVSHHLFTDAKHTNK